MLRKSGPYVVGEMHVKVDGNLSVYAANKIVEKIEKDTDLKLKEILREKEPQETKDKEFSTMQWLIKESIDKDGRIPDII